MPANIAERLKHIESDSQTFGEKLREEMTGSKVDKQLKEKGND